MIGIAAEKNNNCINIQTLENDFESINAKKAEAIEKLIKINSDINVSAGKLSMLLDIIEKREFLIKNLENEINLLNEEKASLNNDIRSKEIALDDIRASYATCRANYEDFASRNSIKLAEIENIIKNRTKAKNILENELKSLRIITIDEISDRNIRISKLDSNINNKTKAEKEINCKISAAEERLEAENFKIMSVTEEKRKLIEEKEKIQDDIKLAEEKRNKIMADIKEKEEKLNDTKEIALSFVRREESLALRENELKKLYKKAGITI